MFHLFFLNRFPHCSHKHVPASTEWPAAAVAPARPSTPSRAAWAPAPRGLSGRISRLAPPAAAAVFRLKQGKFISLFRLLCLSF